MNVVIYARYSSDKQREESIEAQLKVCHEYADRKGYTVISEYTDRAMTGRSDDRPQFQKMIRDSKKRKFNKVLVYRLDRFSRDSYDPIIYMAELQKNNVEVESATENIPEGYMKTVMLHLILGMNASYSVELGEKVTRNMELNAEKCLSNGGTTPLGYKLEKLDPEDEKSKKKYALDEKTSPIVQEIFTKYADGWSIVKICEDLNARHILSAQKKPFNKNSLHTMLKNRKYLGIYIYKDKEIPGGMPQIISQELFDKVQEKMIVNKKAPARSKARVEYILSGKLFCGYCKGKMVGHGSNQMNRRGVYYNYYKCKNAGAGGPCKKKLAPKTDIEDIVVNECRKLLSEENIRRISKEVVKISKSFDDRTELDRLQKLMKKAEEEKHNQIISLRACTTDDIRNAIFEDLGNIAKEMEDLEKAIAKEEARHYILTEEQVSEHLQKLAVGDVNDLEYRRTLIKVFVSAVYLYDDKFTITFNTGDEEVTISDVLLEKIAKDMDSKKVCLSNISVHQAPGSALPGFFFTFGPAYAIMSSKKVSIPLGGFDLVTRVFVEKRPGFDIEARHMLSDLRDVLGVPGLTGVRVLNRYDVEGLSPEEFRLAAGTILSEPNLDNVYPEDLTLNCRAFAMEYLPGQYDQRADSAAQCVQLLTQGERPAVATAKVIGLIGDISDEDFGRVKAYLINPVESREASMDKPESLELDAPVPADVRRVTGFTGWDRDRMAEYYDSMSFAMTLEDLIFCQGYFRDEEHRDPSVTELRVIDTYWSDHCRHTTFLTRLDRIDVEDGPLKAAVEGAIKEYLSLREELYGPDTDRPVSLMDMATIGGKYLRKKGLVPDLDVSDEINACSIEAPVTIDGETQTWLIQFKNETHNHPTEIEPFGGAATCLGGAIRDPLSGRAYVYQAMRVTGSGDPTVPLSKTLPGKLPSRKITTGAAAGYSSYGNQVGLATGQVSELYDPGYVAKRLEIGAVVGASPKENVRREEPVPGDVIALLGGATGRDGIGGATGSSKAHTEKSVEVCGAQVQKGNPPTERKIQRLFRDPRAARLIKRCNDFGAGGVCVAIGELAPGLLIDLDKVPKKYEGLDGTELAISESQERMAVVLAPEDVDSFKALAAGENLDAQSVAIVTESPRLKMEWRGDRIVDISRAFLDTNGVTQNASALITAPKGPCAMEEVPEALRGRPGTEALLANMARIEVCGQKGLSERFDSVIGAGTVLMPFGGLYQLTPEEAMVGKIPLLSGETDDATAMAWGYIPRVSRWSPFMGAAYAVVESLSKLAAVGADPLKARLTFQEYFPRLHEDPARWGQPAAALLGALSAQIGMGLPAIGGKDSMSGSFEDLDVPPTLVSFALSMTRASRTLSACVKHPGTQLALIPIPKDESGMPCWPKLKELYRRVLAAIDCGEITAMSVVREGGAAAAAMRMCFGNKLGFKFQPGLSPETLWAPMQGAMVAALSPEAGVPEGGVLLGRTTGGENVHIDGGKVPVDELIAAWSGTLEKVFPNLAPPAPMPMDTPLCTRRGASSPAIRTARPRVFIPAFPGTNSEVDSARAFQRAGAEARVLVVRNLTPADIEDTIREMERAIRESQIVMIPGGFSGGDEPEGSGKFIATTFRNPRIAEAVMDLLDNRDGLMLGICNGFQALIKLGLLPYGRITEPSENAPTLTFNSLGRHASRLVYTRVTSVKSPWLRGTKAGDVHTIAISHGEGRFVASDEALRALTEGGQIATQYVDPEGAVSGDIQWNPNGSVCAVEGITSPDGRILGKMGHNERWTPGLFKNVPGHKDQKLFRSGVEYFA